jgi:Mg/Co/Ni transporter MgtE
MKKQSTNSGIRATHSKQNDQQLEVLNDMHHADIAEILDELDFNEALYL